MYDWEVSQVGAMTTRAQKGASLVSTGEGLANQAGTLAPANMKTKDWLSGPGAYPNRVTCDPPGIRG